jgi:hypothetical protein
MHRKTFVLLSLGFLLGAAVTAAALAWYATVQLDHERQRTQQARQEAERATRLLEEALTNSLPGPLPRSARPRDLKDLERLVKDLELLRELEDVRVAPTSADPDAAYRAAFQRYGLEVSERE